MLVLAVFVVANDSFVRGSESTGAVRRSDYDGIEYRGRMVMLEDRSDLLSTRTTYSGTLLGFKIEVN